MSRYALTINHTLFEICNNGPLVALRDGYIVYKDSSQLLKHTILCYNSHAAATSAHSVYPKIDGTCLRTHRVANPLGRNLLFTNSCHVNHTAI